MKNLRFRKTFTVATNILILLLLLVTSISYASPPAQVVVAASPITVLSEGSHYFLKIDTNDSRVDFRVRLANNNNGGRQTLEGMASQYSNQGYAEWAVINGDYFSFDCPTAPPTNCAQGLTYTDGQRRNNDWTLNSWQVRGNIGFDSSDHAGIVVGEDAQSRRYNVVAGGPWLVRDGGPVTCSPTYDAGSNTTFFTNGGIVEQFRGNQTSYCSTTANRFTMVGVSQDGRYVYMGVSTGGSNIFQVAEWLKARGAWNVLKLDSGGSTRMIHNGAGRGSTENRAIANHLAVIVRPDPPTPEPNTWTAKYYESENRWFDTANGGTFRCDATISGGLNKDYGSGAPCATGMSGDHWVGDYTGNFPFSGGNYVFRVVHDDGAKFWIDYNNNGQFENDENRGEMPGSNDEWRGCPSGINVPGGNRNIRVMLREETGGARIQFYWTNDLSVCPPSAPNNLRVTGSTETEVTLAWDDTSNEDLYRIYKWNGSNFVLIGERGANVTTYTDGNLTCGGTAYRYKVSSVKSGTESGMSNEVEGRTTNCISPPAPPSPIAPAMNDVFARYESITFSWTSVAGATEYQFAFRSPAGTWFLTDWRAATHSQSSLTYGGRYAWHVKARNAAGVESSWSDDQSFYVRASPPGSLSGTPVSQSQINLIWTAGENYGPWLSGYRVYRNNVSVAQVSNTTTTFSDTGLRCGTSYTYYARAFVDHVESANSNSVTVSTQQCIATCTPTRGDANGDGLANGIDYVIWLNHYNEIVSGGSSKGDFNCSGIVDGVDYTIWLINYGQPVTPPPPDPIFIDDFETGDLSQWTSSTTDGGDLRVSASAALVNVQGLETVVDDNRALFVRNDSPDNEPSYRARFYFDPNSIRMVSGNSHAIFAGYTSTGNKVLRILFRYSNGRYQLRLQTLDDGGTWRGTRWQTISDAPHAVEFYWWAASAARANNGGLALWIDSVERASVSGIDNDRRRIDRVQFGAFDGIDSSTRGRYLLDAFESREQTQIGMAESTLTSQLLSNEPTALTVTPLPGPTMSPSPTATLVPQSAVTVIETDGDQVTRSSGWMAMSAPIAVSGNSYVVNTSPGETIELTFSGGDLAIGYLSSPSFGSFEVVVDGTVALTIDSSASPAVALLQADIVGLTDGVHTLTVRPLNSVVGLDAFYTTGTVLAPVTPTENAEPTVILTASVVPTVESTPELGLPTATVTPSVVPTSTGEAPIATVPVDNSPLPSETVAPTDVLPSETGIPIEPLVPTDFVVPTNTPMPTEVPPQLTEAPATLEPPPVVEEGEATEASG